MPYKIPIYDVKLRGNEKKYVNNCLDSSWISSRGQYIKEFEDSFADYTGIRHATAVANGTVALHLALVTLGIGHGDEVIVPTFTYIASVSSIVYTGAAPVFVDSLPDTWQMDPEDVRKKITSKTKAIMAVHIYGHPCDMPVLKNIAEEHNIFLIEDAAEAFGTKYNDVHAGNFGDISTFSFYGNKTITTGEGGMVVTNDETLYDRAYRFKMHGLAKYREYWHDIIGYNYRMTNICAAIGLAQLEKADETLAKKKTMVKKYNELLKGLPIETHREAPACTHSYWMYSILAKDVYERDELREYLKIKGIETRPAFPPVHTMPMFTAKYQKHHVAEMLGWRGINLPSFPDLTDEQIEEICASIRDFYNSKD